jgi:hypothetical protein
MRGKTGRPRTRPETMLVRIGRSDAVKIAELVGVAKGTPWPRVFEIVKERLSTAQGGQ